MEAFEGSHHPLWVHMPSLGGGEPFLVGDFCLGGVAPPWLLAGIPKKGLSPPIDEKAQKCL